MKASFRGAIGPLALSVCLFALTAAVPPLRPLTVDGKGISVAAQKPGPRVTIRFGTPKARALAALGVLGRPKPGSSTDCDGGPLTWAAFQRGLTIYFKDAKFAGWWVADNAKGIATAKGIRPGSSRAELTKAYKAEIFDSSLGKEFSAGDFYGLFDDKEPTRIASVYAGRTCTAR